MTIIPAAIALSFGVSAINDALDEPNETVEKITTLATPVIIALGVVYAVTHYDHIMYGLAITFIPSPVRQAISAIYYGIGHLLSSSLNASGSMLIKFLKDMEPSSFYTFLATHMISALATAILAPHYAAAPVIAALAYTSISIFYTLPDPEEYPPGTFANPALTAFFSFFIAALYLTQRLPREADAHH